jgi:hypothetical protein
MNAGQPLTPTAPTRVELVCTGGPGTFPARVATINAIQVDTITILP